MKNKILFFCAAFIFSVAIACAQVENLPYAKGKFTPTEESLEQYKFPEWFRDAKFGIWSHWGPQAVPRHGDWYARRMYESEKINPKTNKEVGPDEYYTFHVKTYGHPSEFGYKDIIPMWRAERWNPEELMKLYKKVGAKYFVSMGVHHDNFFLWDTKYSRWNSVNMGPKRDVVAIWKTVAKKEGLFFGVSEHLGRSYTWFQTAHGADKTGPQAGVPYDGSNPEYAGLYHTKAMPDDTDKFTKNPVWQREWYDRIQELVDNYRPDLLYSDSGFPFGEVGRTLLAHYYNNNTDKKGNTSVVYNCKYENKSWYVRDIERGNMKEIYSFPWQTDTSIGDWYYRTGQTYMTSKEVVQMLVDVVSKNGNLLLNIVQTPEGDLEPDVLAILDGIALWIKDNGEAIYGSRPWKIFGEGPSMNLLAKSNLEGTVKDVRRYLDGDIRFTTKNGKLYVFYMALPTGYIKIESLGKKSQYYQNVSSVRMLGSKEMLSWKQGDEGLIIKKPAKLPHYETTVYEIKFK